MSQDTPTTPVAPLLTIKNLWHATSEEVNAELDAQRRLSAEKDVKLAEAQAQLRICAAFEVSARKELAILQALLNTTKD